MSKVLVLYYSAYGHIEAMANAVAEGAREAGAKVDVKRVPETVPAETGTGEAKLACCHPDADSFVKVTLERSVPLRVHRWPTCVPVLPLPL